MPQILSPSAEATVLKVEKSSAITPRRKRMVNVLDILEKTNSERPSSIKKVAESAETQAEADTREMKGKTATIEAGTEAEPIVPVETKLATAEQGAEEVPPNTDIAFERNMAKEAESIAPEAPSEYPNYIIRHASGKRLSEEEIFEAKHYARELKYPKGALVFNGTDEDDVGTCSPGQVDPTRE
jgi:predicted P-loop ATPase